VQQHRKRGWNVSGAQYLEFCELTSCAEFYFYIIGLSLLLFLLRVNRMEGEDRDVKKMGGREVYIVKVEKL
jgi:hypothetical protein